MKINWRYFLKTGERCFKMRIDTTIDADALEFVVAYHDFEKKWSRALLLKRTKSLIKSNGIPVFWEKGSIAEDESELVEIFDRAREVVKKFMPEIYEKVEVK